jgi:hypothetical protein
MFDDLLAAHGADPSGDLEVVRKGLEERVGEVEWAETEGPPRPLVRARERLELARDIVASTQVAGDGFRSLRGGLAMNYRRGQRAMRALQREGTAEQSHEWRKAVKYGWHHLQLLEDTAPSVLGPAANRFHQLSDALGDAHNLAVMRDVLEVSPTHFGGTEPTETVLAMAALSRAELEQRAIRLGARLYAETAQAFGRRLHAYWRAARQEGVELPTGELADITPKGGDPDGAGEDPAGVVAVAEEQPAG